MIELKMKPLSVNEVWQGRRFKTNKYKSYEKEMILRLPNDFEVLKDQQLHIELDFYFSSKGSDIDNPVKPILDILQKKYKFNDSQIYGLKLNKFIVKKGEEKIYIDINPF
jgi:Holliday junction resolvase RusA-like endonuclease